MSSFELFTLCTKDNRPTIISLEDKGIRDMVDIE